MNKGLDALKTIRHIHDTECGKDKSINKDFDIIEKELKALEKIETIIEDYEKYKSKPYKTADDYIRQIKEVFG